MENYLSQAARDAQAHHYGNASYWAYLDKSALETRAFWLGRGDYARAAEPLVRSLGEALQGNDGD